MPYLDVGVSRRYAHRRVMISVALLLISFTTILSYMGLAKFAVQTSAETEIVHELTFEPAHSHVGVGRTIPFDQMIPGAYTTAQFHAEEGMAEVDMINVANNETFENGQFEQLVSELTAQHLDVDQLPSKFRVASEAEAPVLYHVMEEFNHHLEQSPLELPNAWGSLVITDNQDGLKRLDFVVSWDTVLIENGEVQVDEDGNPLFVYEQEVIPVLDENGEAVLDENGEAVVETVVITDEAGNPIPVRRIYSSHLFIHLNSAYFD
jgi:hypothetical protein